MFSTFYALKLEAKAAGETVDLSRPMTVPALDGLFLVLRREGAPIRWLSPVPRRCSVIRGLGG